MKRNRGQQGREGGRPAGFVATGLALALALCGGCLKIDADLALNADGSGVLKMQYGLTESALDRMTKAETMTRQLYRADHPSNALPPQAETPLVFTEAEVRALLKPFEARGIRITHFTIDTRHEWRNVQLDIAFKDVRALFDLPYFSACAVHLKKSDAQYRLTIDLPQLSRYGPLPDMHTESNRTVLSPILAGLAVTLRIDAPAAILASNAERKTLRAAQWEFDFDRDSQAIAALDHYPLQLAFKANGVALPAYERNVVNASSPLPQP